MTEDLEVFLRPTPAIESEHPEVAAFAREHAAARAGIDAAVRVFYAVRDGIRYDPYTVSVDVENLKASATLLRSRSWCVGKAVLLAACYRSLGLPARLGFADVRNHLSTARMRAQMQTDVFYWHGYTSVLLEGKWLKATPAFNLELCQKFGFQPLEFDGRQDSLFQPFDTEGKRHMEYIRDRGEFADLPLDAIRATFANRYLNLESAERGDFDREVEAENRPARR
jgi:transglutaminase-like putative cysteine protease